MYKEVDNIDDFVKEIGNKYGKFVLLDNDEKLMVVKKSINRTQNRRLYKVKNINTNEEKLYTKSDIERFAFRKDAFTFYKGQIYGKFKILEYIEDDGINKKCYKIQNINTGEILYYKQYQIINYAFKDSVRESQLKVGETYGKFKILKYLGHSKYLVFDSKNNNTYVLLKYQILDRMNTNSHNYLKFEKGQIYGKFKILDVVYEKIGTRAPRKRYVIKNLDNGKIHKVKGEYIKYNAFNKSMNAETADDIISKSNKYGKFIIIDKNTEKVNNHGSKLYKVTDEVNGEFLLSAGEIIKQAFNNYYFKHWYSKYLNDIYYKMISRCYNTNDAHYSVYGGRGIKICNEWYQETKDSKIKALCKKNFNNWAIANGYQDGLSIDRYDNNGNYCPENCQWTDYLYNCIFKGNVKIIHLNINGYHIYASETAWSNYIFNSPMYLHDYLTRIMNISSDYERLSTSVNLILNNLPQYFIDYVTRGIPSNMIMPVFHVEFDRRKPWYIEWLNTMRIY